MAGKSRPADGGPVPPSIIVRRGRDSGPEARHDWPQHAEGSCRQKFSFPADPSALRQLICAGPRPIQRARVATLGLQGNGSQELVMRKGTTRRRAQTIVDGS
jgi:hypothetical protein